MDKSSFLIAICASIILSCVSQSEARPFLNDINRYHASFWQNAINNHHDQLRSWGGMVPAPQTRKGFGGGRPYGLGNSISSFSSRPQLGISSGFGTLSNGWNPVAVQMPSLNMGQTLQVSGTASVSSSHLEQMHLVGDSSNPAMANLVFGSGAHHSFTGDTSQQAFNGTIGQQISDGQINGGGSQLYQIQTMGDVNHVTVGGQSDAVGSGTVIQHSFSDTAPLGASNPTLSSSSGADEEGHDLLETDLFDDGSETDDADIAEFLNLHQSQIQSNNVSKPEEPLFQNSIAADEELKPNQENEELLEAPVPVQIFEGSTSILHQPSQSVSISEAFPQAENVEVDEPEQVLQIAAPQEELLPVVETTVEIQNENDITSEDKPLQTQQGASIEVDLVPEFEAASPQEFVVTQSEDKPLVSLGNIPASGHQLFPFNHHPVNVQVTGTAVHFESGSVFPPQAPVSEEEALPEELLPLLETVYNQQQEEAVDNQAEEVPSTLDEDESAEDTPLASSPEDLEALSETIDEDDTSITDQEPLPEDNPSSPIYLLIPLQQLLPVLETLEPQQDEEEIEDDKEDEEIDDENDETENGLLSQDMTLMPPASIQLPSDQEDVMLLPQSETTVDQQEVIEDIEGEPDAVEDFLPTDGILISQQGSLEEASNIILPQDGMVIPQQESFEETSNIIPAQDGIVIPQQEPLADVTNFIPSQDAIVIPQQESLAEATNVIPSEDGIVIPQQESLEEASNIILSQDSIVIPQPESLDEATNLIPSQDAIVIPQQESLDEATNLIPSQDAIVIPQQESLEEASNIILSQDGIVIPQPESLDEATNLIPSQDAIVIPQQESLDEATNLIPSQDAIVIPQQETLAETSNFNPSQDVIVIPQQEPDTSSVSSSQDESIDFPTSDDEFETPSEITQEEIPSMQIEPFQEDLNMPITPTVLEDEEAQSEVLDETLPLAEYISVDDQEESLSEEPEDSSNIELEPLSQLLQKPQATTLSQSQLEELFASQLDEIAELLSDSSSQDDSESEVPVESNVEDQPEMLSYDEPSSQATSDTEPLSEPIITTLNDYLIHLEESEESVLTEEEIPQEEDSSNESLLEMTGAEAMEGHISPPLLTEQIPQIEEDANLMGETVSDHIPEESPTFTEEMEIIQPQLSASPEQITSVDEMPNLEQVASVDLLSPSNVDESVETLELAEEMAPIMDAPELENLSSLLEQNDVSLSSSDEVQEQSDTQEELPGLVDALLQ